MLGISNSVCNMRCSVSRPLIRWMPCGTGLPAWDTPDGGRCSPRKQPTFRDTTAGFPGKWHLRNKHGNSMLMTPHYPDPGTASDWLKQISHAVWPIRSTTQIWIVIRHQYGISALVSQTSFRGGNPVVASANVGCFLRLVKVRKNDSVWTGVIFPRFPQHFTSASCLPFKRSSKATLLDILQTEDSYIDVDTIIMKMKK